MKLSVELKDGPTGGRLALLLPPTEGAPSGGEGLPPSGLPIPVDPIGIFPMGDGSEVGNGW